MGIALSFIVLTHNQTSEVDMKRVQVTHLGMQGYGLGKAEAKKDAIANIEKAMLGSYTPTLITCRAYTLMLWRDPMGWHSSIIRDESGMRTDVSYSTGSQDYYEEYASALLHLAQCSWDGNEEFPPFLQEIALRHPVTQSDGWKLLREFASWRRFQMAYKYAKANAIGVNDHEWHSWACGHSQEENQWPAQVA